MLINSNDTILMDLRRSEYYTFYKNEKVIPKPKSHFYNYKDRLTPHTNIYISLFYLETSVFDLVLIILLIV